LSPAARATVNAILWVFVVGSGVALTYFIIVPGNRTARISSTVFWYVLPALALMLAVWALRSPMERRVSVTLLLFSAIGSAFAAEALLRSFPSRVEGLSITTLAGDSVCHGEFRRQAGCLAAAAMGAPFDRRTTLDVIQDFKAQGIEAWPSLDASHYIDTDDPIEVEGRVVVPLSPGIPEVLAIIGDSFVHGWCSPFEQTLVGQVRGLDSGVLGVGLEGSGPLAQLGLEVEYVAPLSPAVVVWVFFEGNDLRDFETELSDDLLTRYLTPGFEQGLRELRSPLDRKLRDQVLRLFNEEAAKAEQTRERREAARRRRESIASWMRLSELRSRLSDLGRSRKPEHPYDPAVFDQVASRMRDDVTGWGGTLLFAYLPDRTRFEDSSTANPHRASILAQVQALGIPTVDLSEPLAAHPDPLSLYPFRVESHFTAEGNELVARALEQSITRLRSLPPETRTQAVDPQ
jgi:hypothetical protein